jgi:hypothetical protein
VSFLDKSGREKDAEVEFFFPGNMRLRIGEKIGTVSSGHGYVFQDNMAFRLDGITIISLLSF